MLDLKSLLSGSDIRGNAIAHDGNEVELTDEIIYWITKAFAYWLSAKTKSKMAIAVGHDSRVSAERIETQVIKALKESGCIVLRCGLCSTPSMFMMTQHEKVQAHGAIMITASHHPYYKNGLKFFDAQGGLEKEDIIAILDLARTQSGLKGRGKVIEDDYLQYYCESLIEKFRKATGETYPLKNLKIVVDAGNGAGGFFVDRVLKPLGADTSGSQYLEPDGMFPNHIPNPEDPEAMRHISKCVLDNKADFGIIFDTDVDRAACVASDGQEINRNRLIALISAILLEEQPGATIVTDSVTSDALTDFIVNRQGNHHRFKRGYKNVINEAKELNRVGVYAPLAIETSGHAAFLENYFLDDGAYLVIRILIKLCQLKKQNKTLLSLIEDLKEPAETFEVRLGFRPICKNWKKSAQEIMARLEKVFAQKIGFGLAQSYEGVRINFADGWMLIRQSVHDPILPINIESDRQGGVFFAVKKLYSVLKKRKELDLNPLKTYILEQKLAQKNKRI
ncbi:MAG TPA: phosphomannomutase/phosphoglucomutase [Clostridiales bacterium]|nr:phosphomannomutase/phosphoglucomutase [Clostridiales bacterium]